MIAQPQPKMVVKTRDFWKRLRRVRIAGYRSLKDVELELDQLNILIGPNGAGKSNLISFFTMLSFQVNATLAEFVGRAGGASAILFHGPRRTREIEAQLEFENQDGLNTYFERLVHAAGDSLIFAEETLSFQRAGKPPPNHPWELGAGHKETQLREAADEISDEPRVMCARVMRGLLAACKAFHLHDTSEWAPIRQTNDVDSFRYLRQDAGNLAAFLLGLERTSPPYYERIIQAIRQVAPFFDRFVLEPSTADPRHTALWWREKGADTELGPHHLSDGTLRTMALIALLLQPEKMMPPILFFDEPELGLHPHAISLLASLLRQASLHSQVIVATQSPTLLNHFEAGDIIVADRASLDSRAGSVFRRLNRTQLASWLDDYALDELWEKDVFGGNPT